MVRIKTSFAFKVKINFLTINNLRVTSRMRFSPTFSLYVIRSLLLNVFYVFLAFCFISFILDLLELIRKAQGKEIFIGQMLRIVYYKLPYMSFAFLPFIFLFGSILTFTKLNNNFEIAAAKSVGISICSLCIPLISTVLLLSILILWVLHPISAIFLDKNRALQSKYFDHKSYLVSVHSKGIWLYDHTNNPVDEKVINAKNVIENGKALSKVSLYYSGAKRDFTTSYIAKTVTLENGFLVMNDVIKYDPAIDAIHYEKLSLPTSLVADQIQESIADPDIIPFWSLNDFIKQVKQSGFSSLKHEVYYQSMLVSPLLYISLMLIALSCSLNLPRQGKLGVVFIVGSIIAIGIFFIDKIVNVMALTGILPISVAVLAPSLTYLLISIAVLIHYEEG